MTDIKVCMLIRYLDQVGGMERQALRLSEQLQSLGVEVFFITNPSQAARARLGRRLLTEISTRVNGIRVYRLPTRTIGGRWSLPMALVLLAWLRPRYNVIHAHQLFSVGWLGALAGKIFRCKTVVKAAAGGHNGDVANIYRQRTSKLILWSLRRADRLVSVSAEIKDELLAAGIAPGQIASIPNGVDTELFQPVADEAERAGWKARLGLPPTKIVTFAGRLHPDKRPDFLLSAWQKVAARRDDCTLVILGGGPLAESLRDTASRLRRVLLPGLVDNMAEYLRATDVFVLPSSTEGISNITLEAMASGLPVVCSRIGGLVDIVEEGENGLMFELDDRDELADKIVYLLENPDAADRLAAHAREMVEQRFALARVAASYRDLYAGLLDEVR